LKLSCHELNVAITQITKETSQGIKWGPYKTNGKQVGNRIATHKTDTFKKCQLKRAETKKT
jgi:hypothetical protein